jgi:hypothetical protein
VRSGFEPTLRLEHPAGWASLHEGEAFFDVYRPLVGTGEGRDVVILVARLDGDDAPGDVIDRFEANPSLDVGDVGTAELDGAEGLRADVEATSESTVVSLPGGSLSAFPGRKLRVYAVDVDGRTVVLVVDAAAERFEEDVEAAQLILESVDFG